MSGAISDGIRTRIKILTKSFLALVEVAEGLRENLLLILAIDVDQNFVREFVRVARCFN